MNLFRKTREDDAANNTIVALVTSTSSLTNSSTSPITEKRFAFTLLEKLLEYVERASSTMQNYKESTKFSLHESYRLSTKDVKFFGKVNKKYSIFFFNKNKFFRLFYHLLKNIFKHIEIISLHHHH
jgi:hypothetical protein